VANRPILVHNFSDLTTVGEVEGVIKRDIMDIFGAKLQEASEDEKWYNNNIIILMYGFCTSLISFFTCIMYRYKSLDFDHYILAREGTPASRHYNPLAVSLLRSALRGHTNHPVADVLPQLPIITHKSD
jgi:hypothetical protein